MIKEFRKANEKFNEKYKDVIAKIAEENKVDLSVASDMFKTNLHFNKTLYKGGGVVESKEWKEMRKDYQALHQIAVDSQK